LPGKQKADIAEELSDAIQSQMEEKETELGRTLTLDEQSAIIKSYGRPILAAGRYSPHQSLIGSMLLPYYWNTLKIALLVALSVAAIAAFIDESVSGNPVEALAHFWGAMWGTTFAVVGATTIVFAVLERFRPTGAFVDEWDPRSLPAVAQGTPQVPRLQSIFEAVFNTIFVLWLLGIPGVREAIASLGLGTGIAYVATLPYTIGPWLNELILAVLLLSIMHLVLNVFNLIRPDWARLRAGTMIATNGFLLVVLISLLRTSAFVGVASGHPVAERYLQALPVLNRTAFGCLVLFAVICAVTVFNNVRRMISMKSRPAVDLRREIASPS
jgi:hypothetical protein